MWDILVKFFHQNASPPNFYKLSSKFLPWLTFLFIVTLAYGLYGALISAPADYQQGDAFRILYVHVPAAWMSLLVYLFMAFWGAIALIWRIKLAEILLISSAPIGAVFTLIALLTGAIWGKPMWGTYWVWDARLTSELILFFLYVGVIALYGAIEDKRSAGRAVSILCLVGVVNIPIIHYSVVWWNTLHQGSTISVKEGTSMPADMLIPLLVLSITFKLFYGMVLIYQSRNEILLRESKSKWVRDLVMEKAKK